MTHSLNQSILPAIHKIKDLEQVVKSSTNYVVLLGGHIVQMKQLVQLAKLQGVNVLLHADLISGLKNDDFGVDFIIQEIAPYGIISTRANVIAKAKQRGLLAIQRIFLLDSDALERSYTIVEKTSPDYIEVLPGIIPEMIEEVYARTNIPIIAGGLIKHKAHIQAALEAGAVAVTTSKRELWTESIH